MELPPTSSSTLAALLFACGLGLVGCNNIAVGPNDGGPGRPDIPFDTNNCTRKTEYCTCYCAVRCNDVCVSRLCNQPCDAGNPDTDRRDSSPGDTGIDAPPGDGMDGTAPPDDTIGGDTASNDTGGPTDTTPAPDTRSPTDTDQPLDTSPPPSDTSENEGDTSSGRDTTAPRDSTPLFDTSGPVDSGTTDGGD